MDLQQQYKELVGTELLEELKDKIREFNGSKVLVVYSRTTKKLELLLEDLSRFVNGFNMDFSFCEFSEDKLFVKSLKEYDIVIVHDLVCAGLIKYKTKNKWIIDIHGKVEVNETLKQILDMYDARIFVSERYKLCDKDTILVPGICPFSDKNKEVSKDVINGIGLNKPIILEIADPSHLIDFIKICENIRGLGADCTYVFACLEEIDFEVKSVIKEDLHIISQRNDLLVNALQREAFCVIDPTEDYDFLLKFKECLWKRTPIISRKKGDLDDYYGDSISLIDMNYSVRPFKVAENIVYLLNNKDKVRDMGNKGREVILENQLFIHYFMDYLDLINSLTHSGKPCGHL